MAGSGGNNQIGELNIGVGINTTPMEAGLKEAESKAAAGGAKIGAAIDQGVAAGAKNAAASVREVTTAVNQSASTIGKGGAFDSLGKSIKDSTAGIRTFLNSITSGISVVTRFAGLFGLVTGAIIAAGAAAKVLIDNLSGAAKNARDVAEATQDLGVSGAAKKLVEVQAELDKVSAKISEINEKGRGFGLTDSARDYNKRVATEPLEARKKVLEEEAKWLRGQTTAVERMKKDQVEAAAEADGVLERNRLENEKTYTKTRFANRRAERNAARDALAQEIADRAAALKSIEANRRDNEQAGQNARLAARRERREDYQHLVAAFHKAMRDAVREATKETLSEIRDLLKAQVTSTRQVEQQTRAVKNGMYRGGDR